MCYSFESSMNGFVFGIISIIVMLCRGTGSDKWNAKALTSIVPIQLLEAMMWSDVDNKKGLNNLATRLIAPTIAMQPVTQLWGSLEQNPKLTTITYVMLILSMIIGFSGFSENKNKITTVGPNGHLVWAKTIPGWFVPIYLCGLILPLALMKPLGQGLAQMSELIVTVIYSFYNYKKSGEASSMWCWLASIYEAIAVGGPMLY